MSRKVRIAELSQYLNGGRSIHTIYKDVQYNRIPYERVGRTLFFDLDNIDVWMESQGNGDAIELQSWATQAREERPKEAVQRQRRGRKQSPSGSAEQKEKAQQIAGEILAQV